MSDPAVIFREYREDIYDENGYLVERDVPLLVGEIDARDELGCWVCYSVMGSAEMWDNPQYRELNKRLVTSGVLRELEKQRGKA